MRIRGRRKPPSPPPSSVGSSEDPAPQQNEQEVSSLQVAGKAIYNEASRSLPCKVPYSVVENRCTKRSYDPIYWSFQRYVHVQDEQSDNNQNPVVCRKTNSPNPKIIESQVRRDSDIEGSGTKDRDQETSDSDATLMNGKVSNAAVFTQPIIIPSSSDRDEMATQKSKKVCNPNELMSKRIGRIHDRKMDSSDVNMRRSKCKHDEMTQVGYTQCAHNSGEVKTCGKHNMINNLEMPSNHKFDEENNMLVEHVDNDAKKRRRRFRLLSEIYGNNKA